MLDAFKTEIIEAEKDRTGLLKWKLIITAVLGSIGLGLGKGFECPKIDPILTLSLIPLTAAYIDLLCNNLQMRILVINAFFQNITCKNSDICKNPEFAVFIAYEKFCAKEQTRSMFSFENWAQVGFTLFLSLLLIIVSFIDVAEDSGLFLYNSGCIGLLSSWFINRSFRNKQNALKSIDCQQTLKQIWASVCEEM
ncbi:MAG: hypothetical protein D3910_17300 [Candidatus Electrothrix sp. ATG2]|nr:hypothetical protein [Candidatus Electrothrix sp. ATG2]